MGEAVDGKIPYDKDAFATHAARVAALTPMLPEGFPEGSALAGKSAAKPEIWKNRAEFDELMKKLAAKSAALAEVAKGGDLAKIKPAFTDLTQVCKSCHDKFRATVLEFDTAGNLLKSWGGPDYVPGWPTSEQSITTDKKGNVWIAGQARGDSILKFSSDGKLLWDFGRRGPPAPKENS